MYHCKITGKVSGRGEGMNKLVVATRVKKYQNWDRNREEYFDTFGTEIVKEVSVSEEGMLEWNVMTDSEKELFKKRFL